MDKDLDSQLLAGSVSNASEKQLGTVLYLWSSIIFVFKSIREEIVPEADVFILRMVLHRYHKPINHFRHSIDLFDATFYKKQRRFSIFFMTIVLYNFFLYVLMQFNCYKQMNTSRK